jgi:ribosome-associated protein
LTNRRPCVTFTYVSDSPGHLPDPVAPDALAGGIEFSPGVRAPAGSYRFAYARSSGPGGQNVNKLNTRAEIWVRVDALIGLTPAALARLKKMAGKRLTLAGELHLSDESSRSQETNRRAVIERLQQMVETARVEPKRRRKTRPTLASKRRRLEGKKRRSETKTLRARLD